jgi:hypothetical protein
MNKIATTPMVVECITDPVELGKTRAQDERFQRNLAWFWAHAAEIYRLYRGKCLCIAGQELFVADSAQDAIAKARTAHPDDDGWFTRYVYREKRTRIYAHRWSLEVVR